MRAILLLLLVVLPSLAPARELRVVGSDLLGPDFVKVLRDYARRNEFELTLDLEGSRDGLDQLRAGRAEIALLVLRPGETPPAAPWHSIALAHCTPVILVAADLPLSQITFAQLAGIFGANSPVSHTRWDELGAGVLSSRNITPLNLTPSTGLAGEYFRQAVLHGGPFKPAVARQELLAGLLQLATAGEGTIALAAALPSTARGVKAVPVAKGEREVAFGPTPQNVQAGDYPLRLPLWLVIRREAVKVNFGFLRFLLGDEVAAALEQAQLMPASRPARDQFSFDLEQL